MVFHDVLVDPMDPDSMIGLTQAEVLTRQAQAGYNELASSHRRNLWSLAWETMQDPIFLLLLGGGIVYWVLGDRQEALILLGFVFFIMGISLYQEGKTENALAALRDLSSPRALVIRDGQQQRIVGREVMRGDLLVLAEGDRVPADAQLLSSLHLSGAGARDRRSISNRRSDGNGQDW